jgi:hypothetical protein
MNKSAAPFLPITPFIPRNKTTDNETNRIRIFSVNSFLSIFTLFIIVPTAKISPILHMHEPTALPTAIPEFPILLDDTDTMNSGMVVTRLTKVEAINTFDNLNANESSTAPLTRMSAVRIMQMLEKINIAESIKMFIEGTNDYIE